MSTTIEKISLGELYFPKEYKPKLCCALARLIASVGIRTLEALREQNYREFDANPGDSGCQNRAFALRRIASANLNSEMQELENSILREIAEQNMTANDLKNKSFRDAFEGRYFGPVCNTRVSAEMGYLMLCRFLTFLKTINDTSESGIITTKTTPARMEALHPRKQ